MTEQLSLPSIYFFSASEKYSNIRLEVSVLVPSCSLYVRGRKWHRNMQCCFALSRHKLTWVEDTLNLLFRKGLNLELKTELVCRGKIPEWFHWSNNPDWQFNSLPVRIMFANVQAPATEPTQLGYTHLTSEERDRQIQHHLCLYCGQAGHLKTSCPIRPTSTPNRWMLVCS